MTEAHTLKPCPFCGKEPDYRPNLHIAGGSPLVKCAGCAFEIDGFYHDDPVAAWNTRAAQPTACTECERLAEALEDIAEHETDCPSMTATEAMEHTLSEIRDKARFALASHTVRLIDGGSS